MKKIVILCVSVLLVLNTTAPVFANQADPIMVTSDLVAARPLGLVATVIGSAIFVIALPFAITSKSVDETAQSLVGEPFRFTFSRPLGMFDSGTRERGYGRATIGSKKPNSSDDTSHEGSGKTGNNKEPQ